MVNRSIFNRREKGVTEVLVYLSEEITERCEVLVIAKKNFDIKIADREKIMLGFLVFLYLPRSARKTGAFFLYAQLGTIFRRPAPLLLAPRVTREAG